MTEHMQGGCKQMSQEVGYGDAPTTREVTAYLISGLTNRSWPPVFSRLNSSFNSKTCNWNKFITPADAVLYFTLPFSSNYPIPLTMFHARNIQFYPRFATRHECMFSFDFFCYAASCVEMRNIRCTCLKMRKSTVKVTWLGINLELCRRSLNHFNVSFLLSQSWKGSPLWSLRPIW